MEPWSAGETRSRFHPELTLPQTRLCPEASWSNTQDYNSPLGATTQHACAKAIIVGEHGVVYGARAVALPVSSLRLSLDLRPAHKTQLFLNGTLATEHLHGVIADAFAALNIQPEPVAMHCHSSLPVGAGLGSSASLCLVILRALAAAAGRKLACSDLAALGNRLERRFHGTPSGLDTAVVAYERIISFKQPGPQISYAHVCPISRARSRQTYPWTFALIDSQIRASTMAMIGLAAPYFASGRARWRIEQFDALSDQVLLGLASGDPREVASAMTTARSLLTEAGVVTTALELLMNEVAELGVLAVKPTGAGGGGCIIALLDPYCAAEQLGQLFQRFGQDRVWTVESWGDHFNGMDY